MAFNIRYGFNRLVFSSKMLFVYSLFREAMK